jgi:cytochrome oxidase Cu insertion factor (SCO1/SenC/PrrC family)
MQNKKLITGLSLVAVLALFTVLGVWRTGQPHDDRGAVVAGHDNEIIEEGLPSIGGPFQLVDQKGTLRTEEDFRGKPMMIYFGYTYCPDICPMGLSAMSQALKEIGDENAFQPIFITVDPERDTVGQLSTYAQNFDPHFVMLTGDKDHIAEAMSAYRVYAARAPEDRGANDYLIDHSSVIYFMDEKGQFAMHFNHQSTSEEIVKGIKEWQQGRST